jgi:hypothetical protein
MTAFQSSPGAEAGRNEQPLFALTGHEQRELTLSAETIGHQRVYEYGINQGSVSSIAYIQREDFAAIAFYLPYKFA